MLLMALMMKFVVEIYPREGTETMASMCLPMI